MVLGSIASVGGGLAGTIGGGVAGAVGGAIGGRVGSALGMISGALFGRSDPELNFQYRIEFDGLTVVAFKECRGIEWEMEVVTVREGGNNLHERHLMGPAKFKPLEIKRGFIGASGEFYTWLNDCVNPGATAARTFTKGTNDIKKSKVRRTVSLVIYNDEMFECARFNFYNCFISKWSGPALDASSSEIAFESMTVHYEWFEFVIGGAMAQFLMDKLKSIPGVGAALDAVGGVAGKINAF